MTAKLHIRLHPLILDMRFWQLIQTKGSDQLPKQDIESSSAEERAKFIN